MTSTTTSLATSRSSSGHDGLPIHFLPDDPAPDVVNDFKGEFATWIISCGLREMMEHYATMLDHIHRYALAAKQANKTLGATDPEKAHRDFHSLPGVKRKLEI